MRQYGFFIDLSRCIGCHACEIACKQWHNIEPGPLKPLRIYQWEENNFPNTRLNILPLMCFHCQNPICIKACSQKALRKETKYGAILVDSTKCTGDRNCYKACPYGAPQFPGDSPGLKMSKCNMCFDRLEQGLKPICILSCSMRAMEFGSIDELKRKYSSFPNIKFLPSNSITHPAVMYKPVQAKKSIVPWDSDKALKLWQSRQAANGEPLLPVFESTLHVTGVPQDILSMNKLVMKARNSEEIMYHTTDDE